MTPIVDTLKKYLPGRDPGAADLDQPTTVIGADSPGPAPAAAARRTETRPAGLEPRPPVREPKADALRPAAAPAAAGRMPAVRQRWLIALLALLVLMLLAAAGWTAVRADRVSQQLASAGQALMQSQRLAKSVSQALVGTVPAFAELRDSTDDLTRRVAGLARGDDELALSPLGAADAEILARIQPLAARAEAGAKVVLGQQKVLIEVGAGLRGIARQSADQLDAAQVVATAALRGASPAEAQAASQLPMLTQRIGKSASEFLTVEGVSPDAVFLLGKDMTRFEELVRGLQDGSASLGLSPLRDPAARESLSALLASHQQNQAQARAVLENLQGVVAAREAQAAVLADSEPLRRALGELQTRLQSRTGLGFEELALLVMLSLAALGLAAAIGWLQVREGRQRAAAADRERQQAEEQARESNRVNSANQSAILRLMNELQTVAEGDLTQQATVTEDITGAIADSVNYTVEELRLLVGNVQNTATRVAHTTGQVDQTSTELLAASTEQLREIRETGQSVLSMAARINGVSAQAQESAAVARQSLQAAESGLSAVQNTIGGMNAIRDQIQDTAKRIKRLGESSQEIGEITELISDITEQTNVLALNAAIQAASAGEAGRGFSVVAEEVQRLAERSGDATRQIAALVKAIQTDTQDAVGAMERSTQGVVEGARLSDNAGTALSEIDRVSRRLAELIEEISQSASREAESANVVAASIQHIFAVTEQTGEGTRATARQVRELSQMAEELRQSVARFKIA
ncbi:methyl-accepting chemotaxis protein [Pseudacidovorax sp. NFM-22]